MCQGTQILFWLLQGEMKPGIRNITHLELPELKLLQKRYTSTQETNAQRKEHEDSLSTTSSPPPQLLLNEAVIK